MPGKKTFKEQVVFKQATTATPTQPAERTLVQQR